MKERAMPEALFLEDDMTPSICNELCGQYGFAFFGLQYSNECWCSKNRRQRYPQVEDSQCNMKCAGNQNEFCGGSLRLSVFETSNARAPRVPEPGRPLLALVMMVKVAVLHISSALLSCTVCGVLLS